MIFCTEISKGICRILPGILFEKFPAVSTRLLFNVSSLFLVKFLEKLENLDEFLKKFLKKIQDNSRDMTGKYFREVLS